MNIMKEFKETQREIEKMQDIVSTLWDRLDNIIWQIEDTIDEIDEE